MGRTALHRWLVMLAVCIPCSTHSAWGQGPGGGLRSDTPARADANWLEVIEVYTLPWDPHWEKAASRAVFASDFRKSAEEIAEQERALSDRISRSKKPHSERDKIRDRGKEEIKQRTAKLIESARDASGRTMPLTVVRAWDGVSKSELLLTFGRGQRATADRLADGKPLLCALDYARPGDDFQAIRPTVDEIRPSSRVPSDIVRASDAPGQFRSLAFGEVDGSKLGSPVTLLAKKDPSPGSGKLELELASPPIELGIEPRYPWYAEFRLYELDKSGTRVREVRFDGTDAIVSIVVMERSAAVRQAAIDLRPSPAYGRIEVKSPQPWGYEAEIVKWYGVASKDRLVPVAKRGERAGAKPVMPEGPNRSDAPDAPLPERTTPSIPHTVR